MLERLTDYQLQWRREVQPESEAWFALQLLNGPDSETWNYERYKAQEVKFWDSYGDNQCFQNARLTLETVFKIPRFSELYNSRRVVGFNPSTDICFLFTSPTLSLGFFVRDLFLLLSQDVAPWLQHYFLSIRTIISDALHQAETIILQKETCPQSRQIYVEQFNTALAQMTENYLLRSTVRRWLKENSIFPPPQLHRFLHNAVEQCNPNLIYVPQPPCLDCNHQPSPISLFYNRSPLAPIMLCKMFGVTLKVPEFKGEDIETFWIDGLRLLKSALVSSKQPSASVNIASDRLRCRASKSEISCSQPEEKDDNSITALPLPSQDIPVSQPPVSVQPFDVMDFLSDQPQMSSDQETKGSKEPIPETKISLCAKSETKAPNKVAARAAPQHPTKLGKRAKTLKRKRSVLLSPSPSERPKSTLRKQRKHQPGKICKPRLGVKPKSNKLKPGRSQEKVPVKAKSCCYSLPEESLRKDWWFIPIDRLTESCRTFQGQFRVELLKFLKLNPGWKSLQEIVEKVGPRVVELHTSSYPMANRMSGAISHLHHKKNPGSPHNLPLIARKLVQGKKMQVCYVEAWEE